MKLNNLTQKSFYFGRKLIKFFLWINLGGDDVQQLCDAGEDEFLEIMALVGMASKPLHVRRFQKALAEWVSNPGSFQLPISGLGRFLKEENQTFLGYN